jgi:hypothetical protein
MGSAFLEQPATEDRGWRRRRREEEAKERYLLSLANIMIKAYSR